MNLEAVINTLIEETSAYLIILFGSAASRRMRKDSDVDIAFLSNKDLSNYEVFMIAQELSSILNKDVDLIDLSKASTVLKANILGTGRVIYCVDDKKKHEFQIRTFKDYCLLNEERKVILDKIRQRGSIYA